MEPIELKQAIREHFPTQREETMDQIYDLCEIARGKELTEFLGAGMGSPLWKHPEYFRKQGFSYDQSIIEAWKGQELYMEVLSFILTKTKFVHV